MVISGQTKGVDLYSHHSADADTQLECDGINTLTLRSGHMCRADRIHDPTVVIAVGDYRGSGSAIGWVVAFVIVYFLFFR